ncbi:hypothetical protein MNBD_GAMMA17-828 [hydrothermal vent metagenome]|uniref:Uncharacterized protein n=1 Tax=hydrothermal vent metagenome TaxID=652676 RepID=A0A3B1AAQ5_9ZZZZ
MPEFSFSRLPLSWKLLVTGFIIILGSGYLAAVFNTALSVGMNPLKPLPITMPTKAFRAPKRRLSPSRALSKKSSPLTMKRVKWSI